LVSASSSFYASSTTEGNAKNVFVGVDYGVSWGIFVKFFVWASARACRFGIRSAHIRSRPNPTATMLSAAVARNRAPLAVD